MTISTTDWTVCPICRCTYLVLLKRPGDRCGDRSHYYDWPENQFEIPDDGCPGIVVAGPR